MCCSCGRFPLLVLLGGRGLLQLLLLLLADWHWLPASLAQKLAESASKDQLQRLVL